MPSHTTVKCSAGCSMPTYAALAGVRLDRIFNDFDAIVEAYTVGRPLAEKRFGPDFGYGGPNFAAISYGHLNCLGAPLRLVDGGEIAHEPFCDSLAEALDAVRRPVDWRTAGQTPFYLDLWAQLKNRFGAEHVSFGGFREQGPLTTAWAMRGHDFFLDVCDNPDGVHQLLDAIIDSLISYRAFLHDVNHTAPSASIGVADDVAAMLSVDMWRRLVVPVLDRYYRRQNATHRVAHVEDLTPDHLPLLDDLQLDLFDPSVSPRLAAVDLETRFSAAFNWRLNAMQARQFTAEQVRDYIEDGVSHGASTLTCAVGPGMISDPITANVRLFVETAKAMAV